VAADISVLSRFRLAGAALIIGVGLIGAIFYGLLNSHYMGLVLGRTLGPFTDTLAKVGFDSPESDIWQRIATRHGVAILVEPVGGPSEAWNELGEPVAPSELIDRNTAIRGIRTSEDGTRVTFHWILSPFAGGHLPLLGALLLMVVAVIGTAFWFLQRQLEPLERLQVGVEAVARGDFDTRVPVVRADEIGRVAESFNDMAGRVGEMVEDRERLLADVSHELRSPIARMKVALEFVPEGAKRDSLHRDLKEMEDLITTLLEREAMRTRTGRLENSTVDLEALAGEIAASFTKRDPGVELVSDGQVSLEADAALIKLLLQNLVDNALKFSLPDSRPVRIEISCESDHVVIGVVDDGSGIPAGDEEKIFEPFSKLDRARGHRSGHGLGLNLCQRVVKLHGGTIEARPNRPRGTTVVVTFPLPGRD